MRARKDSIRIRPLFKVDNKQKHNYDNNSILSLLVSPMICWNNKILIVRCNFFSNWCLQYQICLHPNNSLIIKRFKLIWIRKFEIGDCLFFDKAYVFILIFCVQMDMMMSYAFNTWQYYIILSLLFIVLKLINTHCRFIRQKVTFIWIYIYITYFECYKQCTMRICIYFQCDISF